MYHIIFLWNLHKVGFCITLKVSMCVLSVTQWICEVRLYYGLLIALKARCPPVSPMKGSWKHIFTYRSSLLLMFCVWCQKRIQKVKAAQFFLSQNLSWQSQVDEEFCSHGSNKSQVCRHTEVLPHAVPASCWETLFFCYFPIHFCQFGPSNSNLLQKPPRW